MLKALHQQVEAMWWHRDKPSAFLRAFSFVYARLAAYEQQRRLNIAQEPSIPMISVGNITVGGSGKTPFVVWLAEALKSQGFTPVLMSRGDGANNQTPHVISAYSLAREIGDEAVLLYRLSGCAVIAGRDRVLGAKMAADYGDVLILDDGFQYRQLKRICDIVLVPADGVGNGCLLPAGPLREPIPALDRADIVVRSGGDFQPISTQKEWSWTTHNHHIRDWNQVSKAVLDTSQSIQSLSSIARPSRFIQSLDDLGMHIAQRHVFPDHHAYTADDIAQLGEMPVVTTGKDAVKLLPLWPCNKPLWVLEQQAIAEEGLLEGILKHIQS